MTPTKAPGLRIVVADDEPDTRQFFQEALAHLGHQVVGTAETGRQLLERCHATNPDLVIADVRMPGTDGIDVAAELNRERPLPVILVSAYSDPETLARASAGPTMTYLVKPVKLTDLQAAIAMTTARFQQLRQANEEAAHLRQALEDRKLIERAKGIVSRRLRVEEAEAYRKLQKLASVHNRKLADVSQQVLNSDKVFQELESTTPA
jgi:response regulator NasT